jgi:hypothetical protein
VRDYPRDTDRDPAAVSGRFLVLVVTGTQRGTTPCQIDWNLDPSSIWHGAFLARQPTNGAREPLAARLVVDGTPLEPVMSYRRPAFRLAEQEWKREGEQLRYYYDMDVVRPRTDGRPHTLVLRTWGREPAPTTFEIEPGGARRLALGYVAWKLATVGPRSRDARRDIRPSSAMSPPVAAMLDSARTGLATAGLRAAVWASARPDSASPSDGVARLLAAEALVSDGDVPLSASVVAGVLRDHPCLVPPAGSSTAIVEQAKAHRAAEPCRPVSPLRAGALSVVPGLGSFVANDRRGAAIGAGLVAVAFARVLVFDSRAKQKYADYQASRTPAEVATMYEAVSDLRAQRGAALNVAAVVWALDALWAMHGAQSHDRRIANDRF